MYDLYLNNILDEDDDKYFLNMFREYDDDGDEKIEFTYENAQTPMLTEIRQRLELDNIAGNGNELSRIANLRKWVAQTLSEGNGYKIDKGEKIEKWDTLTILNEVKQNGLICDCGTYSVVLTEVLLAMGFKAKWVQCLPMDLRYSESHCVTHVYSETYSKWIIADSALDLFYLNRKGIPLGLSELRNALLNSERILIPSMNNSVERNRWVINYWRKNIVRFHCCIHNRYGFANKNEDNVHYYLNPKNFVIKNKNLAEKHINTSNSLGFWTT